MKSKILILTLLITFSMNALTLIDRDRTIDVSLEELLSYPQKQVETSRDKNGKVSIEIWTGVDLKQLCLMKTQKLMINYLTPLVPLDRGICKKT